MNAAAYPHQGAGKSHARVRLVTVLMATFGAAVSALESGDAWEVIEQKRFDSLCGRAVEAYAGDSGDAGIVLTYAHTLASAFSARDLYKKIVAQKSASDFVRADAYYRLACIAYMASNYRKAAVYCNHARKLDDKGQYASLSARAVMQLRGDSAAKPAEKTTSVGAMPDRGGDTAEESKKTPDSALSRVKPANRHCYLQVGAFTAVENAQGLKNELSRFFSQVSITAGVSGSKKIFRVRVGVFFNKESAQAFGDSALAKKGISFRIVEE